MVKVTDRDWAIIAGLGGAADFLTEGRFSAPVARKLKKIFGIRGPVARQAARFVPRALGTARFVAMKHPWVTAAVVTYEVVKHRDEIRQLLNEGWEVVEPGVTAVRERVDPILEEAAQMTTTAYPTGPGISALPFTLPVFKKRTPSAFNKAVSAGMKVIKKSTSYGKKGTIKPAKRAFSVVVKLAAAKKKKKKAPKSGIRRRIWNAMKGLR